MQSKRVKRGEPLADEITMSSGFEVAANFGSRKPSSIESPAVKKEDGKAHSVGEEEKSEASEETVPGRR